MIEIHICGNTETLLSGSDNREIAGLEEDAAIEAIDAAHQVIFDRLGSVSGVKVEHSFRDWNGGRYDQFYCRCGFLAVENKLAGESMKEVLFSANDAMHEAIENFGKAAV